MTEENIQQIPLDGLTPAAREIAERNYRCMRLLKNNKIDVDRVSVPAVDADETAFFKRLDSHIIDGVVPPEPSEPMQRLTFPAIFFCKVAPVSHDGSIDPSYFDKILGAFQKLVDDRIIYFGTLAPPSYLRLPVTGFPARVTFFFFAYPHPSVYEDYISRKYENAQLHRHLNEISSVKGFVREGDLGDSDWSTLPSIRELTTSA